MAFPGKRALLPMRLASKSHSDRFGLVRALNFHNLVAGAV
jgi:hypothetical protein